MASYLAGLQRSRELGEWTHQFYGTRSRAVPPPGLLATFGCFSYARLSADRIRLHFHNAETDGCSPLEPSRRDQRLAELAALFAHVKRTEQGPLRVVGASWLYNLHAYRRLFPKPYLATAHVMHGRFQHLPLWGQFVDRCGNVKQSGANELLERLGRQSSVENLDRCFALQVLALEAPTVRFFEHHGV